MDPGQKKWFEVCCKCLFSSDRSENIEMEATVPSATAVAPAGRQPLSLEEAQRQMEQMKREDDKRRAQSEMKRKLRIPSATEQAITQIERLGRVEIEIDRDAESAWTELFGKRSRLTSAQVIETIASEKMPIDFRDNIRVKLKGSGNSVVLTFNCKQPDDIIRSRRIANEAIWFRENCQMSVARVFKLNEHGEIEIEDARTDFPGGGAKQFYQALLPLYERLGVRRVTMIADEVGSYAWVRYGFRPVVEGEENWYMLRQKIAKKLDDLEKNRVIDRKIRKQVLDLLASNDPNTIEQIADLRTNVTQYDDNGNKITSALGFVLLNKTTWSGVLDLHNKNILDKVYRYIG